MLRILLQSREKVQRVPSLCSSGSVHSQDVPSEPVEAPGPGCDSGRDGVTGSTTMSKSDTFQGLGGFRTPSAPGRDVPPQPQNPRTHSKTETSQRTWTAQTHERRTERGRESRFTQHRKRVRLDREEKEITEIKSRRRIH